MDLGIIVEGVVELDPMSGRMVLRVQGLDGSNTFVDIQDRVQKYVGEEVRFILTPLSAVSELAKMVEASQIAADTVQGFRPPGD